MNTFEVNVYNFIFFLARYYLYNGKLFQAKKAIRKLEKIYTIQKEFTSMENIAEMNLLKADIFIKLNEKDSQKIYEQCLGNLLINFSQEMRIH